MAPACGTDGHSNYLFMFQQVPQQQLTHVTYVICRKGTSFVVRRAPSGFRRLLLAEMLVRYFFWLLELVMPMDRLLFGCVCIGIEDFG